MRKRSFGILIAFLLLTAVGSEACERSARSTPNLEEPAICKAAAESGVTADILDCESVLLAREGKRLNAEYRRVMKVLPDKSKKALREAQRQWIKERDKACAADPEGGTAALVNSASCLQEWTKQRADMLAVMP